MTRTFNFGKVDYYGNGRKINAVEVIIVLQNIDEGYAFSACGYIWNIRHSNIVMGGQCFDEIKELLGDSNSTFNEIYRLWKTYHLNDMHPECEHQRELGWPEFGRQIVEINHYNRIEYRSLYSLSPDKHPDGILGKECPVCGYKYGTAWKYMPIPDEDLAIIKKLLEEGEE